MNVIKNSTKQRKNFGFEEVDFNEHKNRVRSVFESVASRYDKMNDLMSFGLHRLWKRRLVSQLNPKADMRIIDIATGTGDIAFLLKDWLKNTRNQEFHQPITMCDPSTEMLKIANNRAIDLGHLCDLNFVATSAEALPFRNHSFDAVTISFGMRNITDRRSAMKEFHRIMDFGGHFLCLEFSPVVLPILKPFYDAYSLKFIPVMGKYIADDPDAYRYLAESIREFPCPEDLAAELSDAGFSNIRSQSINGGIVAIHSAWRI